MAKESVDVLIEGGKASAAPPLGPALGPLGVNIGQIVSDINNKTGDFKGMKVPVKVVVDTDTKSYEISIGTPPAAQLIKKEAGIQKAAGNPLTDKVADLKIEQIIKIAKMKQDSLLGKEIKTRVKEIIGTCNSMGVMVEGMSGVEAIKAVNQGKFASEIKAEKTEITAAELKEQEEEKKKLQEEMKEKKEEYEKEAKTILNQMKGKEKKQIVAKMTEAGIPMPIINEIVPDEVAPETKAPEEKIEEK